MKAILVSGRVATRARVGAAPEFIVSEYSIESFESCGEIWCLQHDSMLAAYEQFCGRCPRFAPLFGANLGNPYCPPEPLPVAAGTAATPGISSPRKYFFSRDALITGMAAYGFE